MKNISFKLLQVSKKPLPLCGKKKNSNDKSKSIKSEKNHEKYSY